MIDETYNPNDPLFLASRGLDGDLSDDERRRLDGTFRASPALREEAKQLQAVDDLVRRWGRESVEIDWKHHADLVPAFLEADADDAELETVDGLIAAWGRRRPVFDEQAFADAVCSRIAPRRRKTLPTQWVWRIGTPLAAAAAIAMAVTASLWFTPIHVPVAVVNIGPALSQPVPSPFAESRVVVSFVRPTADKDAGTTDEPGIGYMTIGSSPTPWDEPAPL